MGDLRSKDKTVDNEVLPRGLVEQRRANDQQGVEPGRELENDSAVDKGKL